VNLYLLAFIILGIPYIAGNLYVIKLFHGSLKNGYKKEKFWNFLFLLAVGWPSLLLAIVVLLLSGGKIVLINRKIDIK
jgi:hypothetical protein